MERVKNLFKNKKALIGIGAILLIILTGLMIFLITKKDDAKKEIKEQTYTMFIKINPLVKLVFKETNYECEKDGKKDLCFDYSDGVVDYELINDDAKNIYKDIDFKGKSVYDALVILCDTAKNNKIGFSSLEITSDYKFNNEELKEALKNSLKYEFDYEVYINFEEHLNEQEIINKELLSNPDIKTYKVEFDTNGGSKVTEQIVIEQEFVKEPTNPTKKGYDFVEWQLNSKKYNFDTKVTKDITLKAKWKKVEATEKPEPEKPAITQKVTFDASKDKINLNNNYLVWDSSDSGSIDSSRNVYSNNILTVLSDFCSNNQCTPPDFWNLDRESEEYKNNLAKWNDGLSKVVYDDAKAKNVGNELLKYLNSKKGIINVSVNDDAKDFDWSYDNLYIENTDGDEFAEAFNNYFNEIRSKAASITKGYVTIVGGGAGGGGEAQLLNEKLCQKYNLICDRW